MDGLDRDLVSAIARLEPRVFTTSMLNVAGLAFAATCGYIAARVCGRLYAAWRATS
jgi:hypothetical protein